MTTQTTTSVGPIAMVRSHPQICQKGDDSLTELRNRGCRDALIVCCDGLTGLPESISAVWPAAVVQTCVVHLLRASMRYASYTDRRAMDKALRPIYAAATEDAAKLALEDFRAE